MEVFSPDTLTPAPDGAWFPLPTRPLSRAPPSPSWLAPSDSCDPSCIAMCPPPDYPHLAFSRHGSPPLKLYPLCSPSKPPGTIPETDAFAYSTHLAGILDSPPVMHRRVEVHMQKPPTPPPTIPHPPLSLPDPDLDMPPGDDEGEGEPDTDEFYSRPFDLPSPHAAPASFPLSPLSPTWGPSCSPIPSSHDFSESTTLFSICDSGTPLSLGYCHPSPRSPHEPSSLLEVDIDEPAPLLAPISISLPSDSDPEPSSRPWASLADYDQLPPPTSPLISRLDLPDLEDDGLPRVVPSSPSRRSFSHLPDADPEMSLDSIPALPGQLLLSLPGADTDSDLIPPLVPPSRPIPFASNQPLLFIDDPRDVPLPRSPSPEDFDLSLTPEQITRDPELTKLFDLRKRSIAAEREARRLETLRDDVDLSMRAEARKIRKRERERSKEVGALLRLKLLDGPEQQLKSTECCHSISTSTSSCPFSSSQNRRKVIIGSMSQLVAQMVFRRNETSRPLTKRKISANGAAREYVASALSVDASNDAFE